MPPRQPIARALIRTTVIVATFCDVATTGSIVLFGVQTTCAGCRSITKEQGEVAAVHGGIN
jgi:hypothetical protein